MSPLVPEPSVLAVAGAEKGMALVDELLGRESPASVQRALCGAEARRLLLCGGFDIGVVCSPLRDEFGEGLCCELLEESGCQAILLVKSELFDEVDYRAGQYGVLCVSKPVQRAAFHAAYRLAAAASRRLRSLEEENRALLLRLDELKLVSRAKLLLVQTRGMGEDEAHRHIEKLAMDRRVTRREAARSIILKYGDP